MFNEIRTTEDICNFIEKTNSLHDGLIIGVNYVNNGITRTPKGHHFEQEQTKLILKILVTSIDDTIIEMEFENILEWQIKDDQEFIMDTDVVFNDQNWTIWVNDEYTSGSALDGYSYVIAKSMKWRIIK